MQLFICSSFILVLLCSFRALELPVFWSCYWGSLFPIYLHSFSVVCVFITPFFESLKWGTILWGRNWDGKAQHYYSSDFKKSPNDVSNRASWSVMSFINRWQEEKSLVLQMNSQFLLGLLTLLSGGHVWCGVWPCAEVTCSPRLNPVLWH